MAALPWFRMKSTFATNTKIQILPEALQRRYVMLLCLHGDEGYEGTPDDEIALYLKLTVDEWIETRKIFIKRDLLREDGTIKGWEKHQYISDSKDPTASERQKRHRDKNRNATVTRHGSNDRDNRNATVTSRLPDTDTDPEADSDPDNCMYVGDINIIDNNSYLERTENGNEIYTKISDVHMHWYEVHGGGSVSVLDEARGLIIKKRLSDGFSVEDLKLAIEGCALSPHHSGKNKNGDVHNSLSMILRDADQVEKFIAIAKNKGSKKDKYQAFLEEHNDAKSVEFLEVMKEMEAQCAIELCLEQLNLYYESLNGYDTAAVKGAIFDFHQKAEPKDGKVPKVKFLKDYAALRQSEINSIKDIPFREWSELTYWISRGWRINEMNDSDRHHAKTKFILNSPELRSQLPEKLEEFLGNVKAKEKFVELFMGVKEK